MAKISVLIALLPHLLYAMVRSQPFLCSEYFTYIFKPGITDILGQIKVRPPSASDTFILKVALNTFTETPSKVARLELAQSIQESLRNVYQSKPLLYHLYYNLTHEPIPSLAAIWFNDQRYCPSSEVSGNITATIELGHILYPSNEEPLVYNDGPWQLYSQQWHRNSSIYRIDNPSYDRLNNDKCGITSYYTDDANRLIPDGEKIYLGQWPWFVAIYVQVIDSENEYYVNGAGSLLTTKHVITEKTSIRDWDDYIQQYAIIDPFRVRAAFGHFTPHERRTNLTGIINREIADYKLYQYTNNFNEFINYQGLVILILKTAVEYNGFIRSICLWSGSTDLQDIVNMTGYIVGWGNVETMPFHLTHIEEPRTLKVTLTDLTEGTFYREKCLIASQEHLRNHVLCDQGGGLVVFNITTNSYQLRGVEMRCETGIIYYIDVAHRLSWIREQISIIL